MSLTPQNFIDKQGPVVSASWLNSIDLWYIATSPTVTPAWLAQVNNLIATGGGNPVFDTFVATAGQTVFTLSQNPGSVNNLTVFVDGSVLTNGIDFTWTSPSTLTLVNGLLVGQRLGALYSKATTISSVPSGGVVDASLAAGSTIAQLDGCATIAATGVYLHTIQSIGQTSTNGKNLRGTATFAGGTTINVTFPTAEPDTSYFIYLSGNAAGYVWPSAFTTTQFTINCSVANSNTTSWLLVR